ncbi:MAG: hypothetical protein UY01_C0011G0002 [Candidatus Nomurabacteria bacterium GW2011_GWB1_47_6]|uniref:Uncharacterized protein n=1 Tax=Candidatus Nomurabacteria bacterium GW2011_GWB1_47_6 TaxID=1618749 RepID=A0A0G1VZJ7_9BACT|nr:MAG: hypothetical protein UY01_C0011G0002 [Candidatus Nomurabacteria bacterium GW2011_GWB1_47_6]
MQILVTRSNVFSLEGPMGLEGMVRSAVHPKDVTFAKAGEGALFVSGSELDVSDVQRINIAGSRERRYARFSATTEEPAPVVPDRHVWASQDPALMTGPSGE